MRVFSNNEVSQSQVSDNELVLSNEFIELLKLALEFLDDGTPSSGVILVKEQALDSRWNFDENWKEAFDFGVVVSILSKKFRISPFVDDVSLNGTWFSQAVFTIKEIGKVGEVQSKIKFIVLEPFVTISISKIFKFYTWITEKKSVNLG